MNDVIKIQYNNETFEFDVTSLVPEEAVSIIGNFSCHVITEKFDRY